MRWNDDVAWWGWLMMSVGMLVFWGLLAWGAVLLLRGRGQTASADRPSPQEILDERLARGEIDASEYRERLAALHAGEDPPRRSIPE